MSTKALADTSTVESDVCFDMDAGWELHDQVEIRPERFGALLYHFGTRRLSFVKSPELLSVLNSLEKSACARDALVEVGIAEAQMHAYEAALKTLAESQMICRKL